MYSRTVYSVTAVLLMCGSIQAEDDPLNSLAENIPGVPGEDYPILAQPPDTSFNCKGQIPGYYADPEANCQLYHICAGPEKGLVKYDFLCPNGTLFDQQYFVCNWWFNVDCAQAVDFYSLNADVLAAMEAANPPPRDGKSADLTTISALTKRAHDEKPIKKLKPVVASLPVKDSDALDSAVPDLTTVSEELDRADVEYDGDDQGDIAADQAAR